MAKRKYPPIKTVAYAHVGDQLVDTRDLNPALLGVKAPFLLKLGCSGESPASRGGPAEEEL